METWLILLRRGGEGWGKTVEEVPSTGLEAEQEQPTALRGYTVLP